MQTSGVFTALPHEVSSLPHEIMMLPEVLYILTSLERWSKCLAGQYLLKNTVSYYLEQQRHTFPCLLFLDQRRPLNFIFIRCLIPL
jgi:hypothetical protein